MINLSEEERTISSTLIRNIVRDAQGDEALTRAQLKSLVVDGVAEIIIREGLYNN